MTQNLSHAVMAQRHEPVTSLDLFPTPPWATRALCEFLTQKEPLTNNSVWEPACGFGDMVRPLREYFGHVYASDVYSHSPDFPTRDFLLFDPLPHICDWVITNPPFRLAAQFVKQALSIAYDGVAMLVRTAFLEGQDRYETLFKPDPPAFVLQFTERVPMHKGKLTATGSTATSYCWVIWQHGSSPFTQFHWIPPCRKRLERGGDYGTNQ